MKLKNPAFKAPLIIKDPIIAKKIPANIREEI